MPDIPVPDITVHRAEDRFLTLGDGSSTRHSFSYGAHYDPNNVGFGSLLAINDETIDPGRGYDLHHHAYVEIVTWVLEGELRHEDATGNRGVIAPGLVQRLSAGDGVQHSERNASESEPLHFIQMMLRSDNEGEPAYAQRTVDPGRLVPTIPVNRERAMLLLVRCGPGEMAHIPAAPLSYLHVTRGRVSAAEYLLRPGDSLRLTSAGAYDVCAAGIGGQTTEVLIWQMQR